MNKKKLWLFSEEKIILRGGRRKKIGGLPPGKKNLMALLWGKNPQWQSRGKIISFSNPLSL